MRFALDERLVIATEHQRAGRLAEAETIYRELLAENPNDFEVLHRLGILAGQSGQPEMAVRLFERAVALQPNRPDLQGNLGVALQTMQRFEEAQAAHYRAIRLNSPARGTDHYNLGCACEAAGKLDEAIVAFARAVELEPRFPAAQNNLSRALLKAGRVEEAIGAGCAAVELEPKKSDFHNNLGTAWQNAGKIDEAIGAFREAIRLKPDCAEAYNNLGNCHRDDFQSELALDCYRQAHAHAPKNAAIHSNLVYALHFLPDIGAEDLLKESLRWDRLHAQPLRPFQQAHENDRAHGRRLRIGFVSPNFRDHVVGRNLLPFLRAYDRDQAEIYGYADICQPDAVTKEIRGLADHWRVSIWRSDEELADIVRGDRIDILVDLTLHMAQNRLLTFARKPAPVQATYLGYCGGTGLEAIDCRFSDGFFDPPTAGATCYREETVRLPSYWCYEPLDLVGERLVEETSPSGCFTFGCLNHPGKVSSEVLKSWSEILRRLPGSRLALHAPESSCRERLHRWFSVEGIDPDRIEFLGMQPRGCYLESWRRIDVALDSFPYAGGITSCDALWMGTPVVSLSGATSVGRGGASILSHIGLKELIADTSARYVEIALSLASDSARLRDLRIGLRERMRKSPLRDGQSFARSFESAFRRMWRDWCARII